jgi:AcrR family transcriptional regulator
MTPREQPLSRDEVLAAALGIIDRDGLDALSMRHLAAELEVEAMSLYHHFPNKDAILNGVVERIFIGMRMPEPLPERWDALAEEMFVAFRTALADHHNAILIMARRPLVTETSTSFVEMPLAVLSRSGLAPEKVGGLYQSLVAYSFGHAFVATGKPQIGPDAPVRVEADRYPATVAAGPGVWLFDEATFRQTLRHIIRGFTSS